GDVGVGGRRGSSSDDRLRHEVCGRRPDQDEQRWRYWAAAAANPAAANDVYLAGGSTTGALVAHYDGTTITPVATTSTVGNGFAAIWGGQRDRYLRGRQRRHHRASSVGRAAAPTPPPPPRP